ncbi:MAG: N(G),N(G)-dimethylarginine dimethylaminohydrolase, partial [Bacteroidetes bacterium]
MRFTNAIVRLPGKSMPEGLSSSELGKPDHALALRQHGKYVEALQKCGLDVRILPADENFPDSTFVEDTALLASGLAVLTNPGAPSRQGETADMHTVIQEYYEHVETIMPPGTLEAGDVMMAGKHFFIGLSERTNTKGAEQLIGILERHGLTGKIIEISGMLHLKSGVSYLENKHMLAADSLKNHRAFKKYDLIRVPDEESYAANSLWINDRVLVPMGFPATLENIRNAGYET